MILKLTKILTVNEAKNESISQKTQVAKNSFESRWNGISAILSNSTWILTTCVFWKINRKSNYMLSLKRWNSLNQLYILYLLLWIFLFFAFFILNFFHIHLLNSNCVTTTISFECMKFGYYMNSFCKN